MIDQTAVQDRKELTLVLSGQVHGRSVVTVLDSSEDTVIAILVRAYLVTIASELEHDYSPPTDHCVSACIGIASSAGLSAISSGVTLSWHSTVVISSSTPRSERLEKNTCVRWSC